MFKNLRAEMIRADLTTDDLANKLEIGRQAISRKLNGRSEFTRKEMYEIRSNFFPKLTIDYLFE